LQHGKHVREHVNQTVVAGHQNGAWRERLALPDPGSKIFRVNYMVVSFEELELLAKYLWLHQICIEKNLWVGMISRNNAMVVRDGIAAGRHRVIEPSDSIQRRIHRVFQKWANEPHGL